MYRKLLLTEHSQQDSVPDDDGSTRSDLLQKPHRLKWGAATSLANRREWNQLPSRKLYAITVLACEEWGAAKCPLKIIYYRHQQEKCQFQPEFHTWELRTISEGAHIGYKGVPRNQRPRSRGPRTPLEVQLLPEQNATEKKLRRVVDTGGKPPG